MKKQKNSNEQSEIDFTSSSSFKKTVRKTKLKQIILYCFISVITIFVCAVLIHSGSQYLINKKIEKHESQESLLSNGEFTQGAAISSTTTRYYHNMFEVVAKTTIYKKIGNREIIWDTKTTIYPAIGEIEVINNDKDVGGHNVYEKKHRVVRYNQFNNERKVDFYFPNQKYEYLPQELDIATNLNENTLVEVALSFKKPISTAELSETLGFDNVDWLWVNTLKNQNDNKFKVLPGDIAYGFSVSEKYPYSKSKNITISGAVVSGTPNDLEKFQSLDYVRASVIGITIDKY